MKKYLKAIVTFIVIVLVLAGFFLWTLMRMMSAGGPMPTEPNTVAVAAPFIQDVVSYDEFTGNLTAVEAVDVRARVEGYLQQVAFEDGAFVKKGDLLFVIEPEVYIAERDRARAALQSAEAERARAEQDYQRALEAIKSDAVSKQQVSTYKAQRDMAEAAVLSAKAALAQAELNLSYTRIESPIDGKISRNYVDEGNLVGAGENTLLTTVVKLDPVYVYFYAGESEYLDYTKNVRQELAAEPNKLPLYLSLANKEDYDHTGRLDYMDNKVDPETGTIQIRGLVPNPNNKLYPGMFVRLRVPTKTIHDAVLVQARAIGTDLGGKYLLVVDENNYIRHRPVELGPQEGQLRVIASGLSAGETYVVSGLQFVTPGTQVKAVPEAEYSQQSQPAQNMENIENTAPAENP